MKSSLLMMHTSYMSNQEVCTAINHSNWLPLAEDLIAMEFLHWDHRIAEAACHLWRSSSPNPWADYSRMCPGFDYLQDWASMTPLGNLFPCLTTLPVHPQHFPLCLLSCPWRLWPRCVSRCPCRHLHTLLSFPSAFPSQGLQCRN